MANILYKDESYAVVGALFEVYNHIRSGFSEIVYKDALEYEFRARNIKYSREKEYAVIYEDQVLPHKFYADFVIEDEIIFEVKSLENLHDKHLYSA